MKNGEWASKFVYYINTVFHKFGYFFLLLIQIKISFSQYFESFNISTLNSNASLIDITDYDNIFPIITLDKKIYTNIPPIERNEISSKIIKFSAAATYNKDTILMACTEDYLLSKIDIDSGEETPLVSYEDMDVNIPSSTCSISIYNYFVYIGMSHKIVPYTKIKNNEDSYDIIYDYNNIYWEYSVYKIKIKIDEGNNELIIDTSFSILNYTFEYKTKNSTIMDLPNPLTCEIITSKNRLICGYNKNETNSYLSYILVMNENFNGTDGEKLIYKSGSLIYLKLQKKDENSLYFFSQNCYIISLQDNGDISSIESNFNPFKYTKNFFCFNNNYLFYALNSLLKIKTETINYYFAAQEKTNIQRILGYYKEENDFFLFIYENNMNIIKYFTVQNMSMLFQYKVEKQIVKNKSNTTLNYSVSQLITEPVDHYLLSYQSLVYYKSTSKSTNTYNNYYFDKDNQILTIWPTLNDWITFTFCLEGGTKEVPIKFYFETTQVTIRTCQFKCGSCHEDYDICDKGVCKENFALFSYLGEEDCYPVDQNFPNYIYNKTTNKFEKCFSNCKFCSIYDELSNQSEQNCKVCKDGYFRSYTFPGNCYAVNSIQNDTNSPKIIRNKGDEGFEIVNSCTEPKKYRINDTGECVEKCPDSQIYYTYRLNENFNFSNQEETSMGYLYPLDKEKIPKLLFNGICYTKCPSLTKEDSTTNTCNCKNGWHYNSSIDEKVCYNNKDYCLSSEYYYHTDTKECVLNDCKDGYFKMNFECYKGNCPKDTEQISGNRCDSTKNYCYINEKYQTICGNSKYAGYNFNYNDTKIYLKLCSDSMHYFNVKTYLYKNICYEFCPEDTTKNDTNGKCSCKYYIHYLNEEKSDFECLNETQKCMDKNRYNISDKKECVDTIQKCNGYFVFNYDCLLECPSNTKPKENEKICLCEYNYYNNSNLLTCFDQGVTCENKNYPIKMNNNNECFLTREECIQRGFKYYNNICYESCSLTPVTTIENNNDGICRCKNYYYNNTGILYCLDEGETCDGHSYPYINKDTNECFSSLNECISRDLKIFNNNCYNKCPTNTEQKSGESFCICSNYFYKESENIFKCFAPDKTCSMEGYSYSNPETKECFKSEEECINHGYKIFNKECYSKCPENSKEKSNQKCECSSYYTKDENNIFKCFSSESDCLSKNYYFNRETKKCFISKENCFNENKKVFGKECLANCPINSEIKGIQNTCECSYNYFNDNGILDCFNNEQTCETKGYLFSSDDASNKECFKSIDDCIKKGYLFFFDKTCYRISCPTDKILLNEITNNTIKNSIINDLHLDTSIANKLCICDTQINYKVWVLKEELGIYSQTCLQSCPPDYNIEESTKKCYYLCDPNVDFVFNVNCYKNGCPTGTKLNESNPSSRVCICEDNSQVDENTGLITCVTAFPEKYYKDRKNCPYDYNNDCYLKCPENTCLVTNMKELSKCVDIKPTMKIYNGICIEGINDIVKSIYYFEDNNDITTIMTPSGVALSAVSTDSSIDFLMKKYPNLTFVNLAECKKKLLESYKLSYETKLYIVGIDMPNLKSDSSINSFNYEVYLKNGTQLEDLSPCDNTKIYISSYINNPDKVHFSKAIEFYEEGYDIYNRSNLFYTDNCAPAQDNGNDITLVDRAKYYYPKDLICNEGCKYNLVDFEFQRFLCKCNSNLSDTVYNYDDTEEIEENVEDDSSYLDYFLSLINYKIIICINLFLEFKSFYYNAGFYISFGTLLISIILLCIFWIIGIKSIRIILYKNLPSKSMFKEYLKNKNKDEKIKNSTNKDNNDDKKKQDGFQRRKDRKNKISKTIKANHKISLFLNKVNNPPPKENNIKKIEEYLQENKADNSLDRNNVKEENFSDFNKENKIEIFKENKKFARKSSKFQTKRFEKMNLIRDGITYDSLLSSKDNLIKFNSNVNIPLVNEKEYENKPGNSFFRKEIEDKIENNNFIENNNLNENNNHNENYIENKNYIENNNYRKSKKRKTTKRSSKLIIIQNIDNEDNISKKLTKDLRRNSKQKSSRKNKKRKTAIINANNIEKNLFNEEPKRESLEIGSTNLINFKKYMEQETELIIDFNYERLIDIKDDEVDKNEINNVPFRQALRIDKRSVWQILISVFANEIGFLNLFLYRNPYSHLSLTISIYLFELLLDLTMNCFLYTDDVVSEKYHNNGELSMITSLSLSFISNIVSSIIVFIISKLTNYAEIIDAIIKDVKNRKMYIQNINRLFKYIKIRLGLFYSFQLGLIIIMTYYLFIFCTVYHQTQGSIMINYIIGALTSFGISCGLTIIITFLRVFSIKKKINLMYNISKYLYEHS